MQLTVAGQTRNLLHFHCIFEGKNTLVHFHSVRYIVGYTSPDENFEYSYPLIIYVPTGL